MLLTNGAKDALTVSRNPTKDSWETDRERDPNVTLHRISRQRRPGEGER